MASRFFLLSLVFGIICVYGMASPSPTEQPLPLRESIKLALQNNHDVIKAAESVEESEARLSSARSQFFPKIALEVDMGAFHDRLPLPGDPSIPVVPRDRNGYVVQLNVSQSIFSGFQQSSATSRLASETNVARLNLEIAKEKAIEETISLYFGIQLFQKEIQFEKEVQTFREDQLKMVENRMQHGKATDFHELQARYEVKKQVPRIEQLETELSFRRLALYRRLNLPLDGAYKLLDAIPEKGALKIRFKLPSLGEALEYALQNNLKIQSLESQRQALQSESGEALAVHLPKLNLELNAGTNAYQQQDIGSQDSIGYGAQLKLTVPLFSGLDSISDRKVWHSRLDELKEEMAKLRENILSDFNETYRRLETAKNRVEASNVNLDLTERAVRRAQHFYQVGSVTLPEVLSAYSAALEAKKQSMQDGYDQIVAFFHLKSLLGLGATFDETTLLAK